MEMGELGRTTSAPYETTSIKAQLCSTSEGTASEHAIVYANL